MTFRLALLLAVLAFVLWRAPAWREARRPKPAALQALPHRDAPGAKWNREGLKALKAGRHEEAVRAFSEALKLAPDHPALRHNLAVAHFQLGQEALGQEGSRDRFRRAETAFRRAAEADPETGIFAVHVGYACYLAGELDRAAVELRDALRRFPTEAKAYELLGRILYEQGDTDGAAEVLQAGLKIGGPEPEAERLLRKARQESAFDEGISHFFDFRYDGTRRRELLGREHVVARMLDDAYARVGRRLNFFPEDRVQVLLYDASDFTASLRPDAWAQGLFDGKIRVPVRDFEREQERLQAVLFHEYTHAVVYRLSPLCPPWLNEGLATLMERDGSAEAALARLRADRRLLPAERLVAPFAGLSERDARIAYDMAVSMTAKLERDHGLHAIVAYLRELGRGAGRQDELFEQFFYQSYGEFSERWRASL